MPRTKVGAIVNGKYVKYASDSPEQEASFAEMCRLRRPPRLQGTDAINFKGVAAGNPFPNMRANDAKKYMDECKRLGISVEGKRYMTSLVRPEYAGRIDPQAFVDTTGDVARILESRGWGTDPDSLSMVKVKPREVEADNPMDSLDGTPSDDLVEEKVQLDLEEAGVERISKKEYRKLCEKKKSDFTGVPANG